MNPEEILEAARAAIAAGESPDSVAAWIERSTGKTIDEIAASRQAAAEPPPESRFDRVRAAGRAAVRGIGAVADRILPGDAGDATLAAQRALLGWGDEALGTAAGVLTGQGGQAGRDHARSTFERLREERPKRAMAAEAAGAALPIALSTLTMGPVAGAALLGASEGSGESEGGLPSRAVGGAVGGTAGAVLGKAGQKLFELGGAKALALMGAGGGAATGDSPVEAGRNALVGAGGGFVAGRVGGRIGARAGTLAERLGINVLPNAETRAVGELGRAVRREGLTTDDILQRGAEALPGERVVDLGGPRGPMQRLARSVESRTGAGAREVGDAMSADAAISPPRAERSVRRALGNRYQEPTPLIRDTKRAISQETAPDYAALRGVQVRSDELVRLAADEPIVADLWKEAQDLARRRAARGMGDAEELPDLFNPDGSVVESVPVLGVDMLKRALRSMTQRRANSPNPITSEEARILSRGLDDVVNAAKQELPEYAATLQKFGRTTERAVQSLSKRKQRADFVLGGSPTARIQADQADFGEGTLRIGDMSPQGLIPRLLDSRIARSLSEVDEATADAIAPMLLQELAENAPGVARALDDYYRRQLQQAGIAGVLPRAASIGAGAAAGSLSAPSRERSPR